MDDELDHNEYECECEACRNYLQNILHDREMEWAREQRAERNHGRRN